MTRTRTRGAASSALLVLCGGLSAAPLACDGFAPPTTSVPVVVAGARDNVVSSSPSLSSSSSSSRIVGSRRPEDRVRPLFSSPTMPSSSSSSSASSEASLSEAASQNAFGVVSDAVTGFLFSLLHLFDDCGIEDSSKNLRVLWVRALLDFRNRVDDDVAAKFLPSATRALVTTEWGASLLDPVLPFAEWIEARTDFIDKSLDHFLSSPLCSNESTGEELECNIVLFGAGYDTRALRYRHRHGNKARFIEVDLPSVVEGKRKLYQKFRDEHDPEWDLERYGSRLVPFDLNQCGGKNPVSLVETLREQAGLRRDVPTLVVSEAVLFYVNEDALQNIFQEFFDFARPGGNGDSARAETMFCFTDSLKPFVDVPFSNEARKWFRKNDMDLLEHRSRWGGAVHFALASSRRPEHAVAVAVDNEDEDDSASIIGAHVRARVGGLTNSYIPTAARNRALLTEPSFENVWYAVAFPWQIDGHDTPLDAALGRKRSKGKKDHRPFATRLWGEPVVIYRDADGGLVAMADVCPHRSVPMSMGKLEDGKITCMYHGWSFGEGGACVDVPTAHTAGGCSATFLDSVTKANRSNLRAVVEHEGLVWMWRGDLLEADPSLLPSRREGDMETVPIDTVLDYNVDYSYVVENNLDSPHLFYLHDGSIPPIESIGMMNSNLPKLKLTAFTDHCGMGHMGRLEAKGRPKKLLRFDPPNIVRHGGVSGFEEEFHCVPIAPQRTRVLLRQHLPRGPILSTITKIPGMIPALTLLVNCWNYQIALEDSNVMQGQASRIEDWGSPRLGVGGLGDDLIKRFWTWRRRSHVALKERRGVDSPYVTAFGAAATETGDSATTSVVGIPTGTSYGDEPELVNRVRKDSVTRNQPLVRDNAEVDRSGRTVGSWGIKQDYVQDLPAADFPPVKYKEYARFLVFDEFVKDVIMKREAEENVVLAANGKTMSPYPIE